jgi:hypothetical protein
MPFRELIRNTTLKFSNSFFAKYENGNTCVSFSSLKVRGLSFLAVFPPL